MPSLGLYIGVIASPGPQGGDTVSNSYLRPGGVDHYHRPGGTEEYIRP